MESERKRDYPTGDPNGMSFICNRWVFTGPQGYRVVLDGSDETPDGWAVLSYNGARTQVVYGGHGLSEDAAHALAARLSGKA